MGASHPTIEAEVVSDPSIMSGDPSFAVSACLPKPFSRTSAVAKAPKTFSRIIQAYL